MKNISITKHKKEMMHFGCKLKGNYILILFFWVSITNGQIPNSGFENWNSMGTYMNPDGWWTSNDSITSGSFYPVTRSSDHYPSTVGNYSIKIENNMSLLPNWGGY